LKFINLRIIPIEKILLKLGGGAVLLLWADIFSPFGMNRQKRSHLSPRITLSPFGHKYMSEESFPPQRWRVARSDGEG
jgi:hypothetical protein